MARRLWLDGLDPPSAAERDRLLTFLRRFRASRSKQEKRALCPFCGHELRHHDQPDCWECSNAGAICESEVEGPRA